MLRPGEGERLVEASIDVLNRLHRQEWERRRMRRAGDPELKVTPAWAGKGQYGLA